LKFHQLFIAQVTEPHKRYPLLPNSTISISSAGHQRPVLHTLHININQLVGNHFLGGKHR